MQVFQPVASVSDFRQLDEGEVLCGYMDGLTGQGRRLSTSTKSYWHGWRNGLVDGGFVAADAAQMELDAQFRKLRPRRSMIHQLAPRSA